MNSYESCKDASENYTHFVNINIEVWLLFDEQLANILSNINK